MSGTLNAAELIKKGINESDLNKSIEFFNKALILDPDNQEALYQKGVVFLHLKKYTVAYRLFKSVTKLNNKHSEAWYSMGLASEMCEDIIPANKFYAKTIRLDPHHLDALFGALRLNKNNVQKSHCLKKITEIVPEDVNMWIMLIELNLRTKALQEATVNLSNAFIHHPYNKKLIEFQETLDNESLKITNRPIIKESKEFIPQYPSPMQKRRTITQKFDYDEWNPPAPSTVYCKMYGISYNSYKYYQTRSSSDIQIKSIEDKLNNHNYNCACCSSYLNGACSNKNKSVSKDAICKSFEPEKKLISKIHPRPPKNSIRHGRWVD